VSKNSKERFKEQWGVTYSGFHGWLKRHHSLTPSELTQDYMKELTEYYKEKNQSFHATYGLIYENFKDWLERVKEVKIGDLKGDYGSYIEEYKWIAMKNKLTKDEMWELLWRTIHGKALTEKEEKVIDYLSEVEVEG